MRGFLQAFRADHYLIEVRESTVIHYVLEKAIEIAMLGLVDDCNAICQILANHGKFDSGKASIEFQCIWAYSGTIPPDIKDASDGTVWIPSEEEIRQKEIEARKDLSNLPNWTNWDDFNADTVRQMRHVADTSREKRFSCAASGWSAMLTSSQYAATLFMAAELGHLDMIAEIMPIMVQRIHANQQAKALRQIPIRKPYTRMPLMYWMLCDNVSENGPRRPEEIYPDYSMRQLLDVIDYNTVSSESYEAFHKVESSDGDTAGRPRSILHPGATSEQIAAAEQRIGHALPADMKTFFELTDGYSPIRAEGGFHGLRLLPLDQICFEKENYMEGYFAEVVPRLPDHLSCDWPGIREGAIAMYEPDGQGTIYFWVLGAEDIKRSKEQLQNLYDKSNEDDKNIINHYIDYWYGGRETYDSMTDHCYTEILWGEGTMAVYPTFKAYLAKLAWDSRPFVEASPLTATFGNVRDG